MNRTHWEEALTWTLLDALILRDDEWKVHGGWSRHHRDIVRDYIVKLKSETLEGGRHNIDLFENADNHRFARSWVQGECEEYDKARENGCCGFHDVGLNAEEGTIRVGWNYGH